MQDPGWYLDRMLLSRLRALRIPRPVGVRLRQAAAVTLPVAAVAAALSLSNATGQRFFPPDPPTPSPYIIAPAANSVPGACQVGALVTDGGAARGDVLLRLARVTAEGSAEVWQAITDGTGVHRFLDLPAGSYQLTALTDNRAPAAADFRCGGDDGRAFLTLDLVRADHVLSGRVTSSGGAPAPGAEIAIGQDVDARTSLAGTARIPVDQDGSFHVRMAPGDYVVLVQAPNHAPLLRKLHFDGSAPASVARFTLVPTPHVRGRVVDEDGAPLAGARVSVGGMFDPTQRVASVTTDADGTFSLPVADGQDVDVTAHSAKGLVARVSLGVVHGAYGLSGVNVVARAGRAVEGVVMKPDGSAWSFGEVRYRVRDLGLTGVEKADADGHFVVDGMPTDADVEVWAEGNASGAWGAQVASPGNNRLALVYTPPAY